MPDALLEARGLVAGYVADADILHGIDAQIYAGEIVSLVGPNGAGKSTLIRALIGLLRPRLGRVFLRGSDVTEVRAHLRVRRGVGYVAQRDNVFPSLTVDENLELGMTQARKPLDTTWQLFPHLHGRRRQQAGTLSGGERQMLAMARALITEPDVLLLDEPSAGLSPALVDAIFEKIADINAAGVSILMVEQNARRALEMSTRAYVLDLGRNRFEGTGTDLLHDSSVIDLYLGGTARIDEAPPGTGAQDAPP
jgi:ABC-type branched-subunit amino acid transport system ATPase component